VEERYPMPEWFKEWLNRLDPGPTEELLNWIEHSPNPAAEFRRWLSDAVDGDMSA